MRTLYKVTKVDSKTGKETNYGGGYTEEDVKDITRGYKNNGLYYERIGSKYFFMVNAE